MRELFMIIGLDIGGTNIKGVIINNDGTIMAKTSVTTGAGIDATENNICHCIETLLELSHINKKEVDAVGIGSAGAIDKQKGMVITSPNIPAWNHYPIVQRVEKITGYTVFLENDANAAVVGELWLGNGKNYKNWIMLTLGTGIGGGAVINGMPYTGNNGSAMEFGHITIDYNGLQCKCGRKGCLECYGSATAVVHFVKSHGTSYPDSSLNTIAQHTITARHVYDEAKKGDSLALYVFNLIGTYLGIGIADLVNIFNPEAVILGGGLSSASQYFLPQIIHQVQKLSLEGMKENIRYMITKHGDYTAAIGAAKYALETI